jgi:transposase
VASDKKGAQERAATLVFYDEGGFSLKPSVRRTWAPRGQTPLLRHKFNWKRLHATANVVCQPDGSACDLLLSVQEQAIKEDAVIAHLEALHQQVPGLLFVLWDGLPAHRSKKVQQYLADNAAWLVVHRFPAYAPELNPVEYVWSPMKGHDLANFCPDTIGQIQHQVDKAHQRLRSDPTELYDFLAASGLFPSRHERSLT